MHEPTGGHYTSFRLGVALGMIGLFSGTLLFVNLGASRVLTWHETLFAQPAREMNASGRWLAPTIGGVIFPDKPPMTHWLVAMSMRLFGSEAEWVARAPIALTGVATALLVGWLASVRLGLSLGVLAGLIQASCYYTLMQARLAESDMPLCLFVTAALTSYICQLPEFGGSKRQAIGCRLALYFFAACAGLTKGLLGPIFVFGAIGLFLLIRRERTLWLQMLRPSEWLVFFAVFGGWIALAYSYHPEILHGWYFHHVQRFTGELGVKKSVWFYVFWVPVLLAPWTPFAAIGVGANRFERLKKNRFWQFLACWFMAGFLVISASAWKHKHYAIPCLPPLSLFAALGLKIFAENLRRAPRASRNAFAVSLIGFVLVLGVAALAPPWAPVLGLLIFTLSLGIACGIQLHQPAYPLRLIGCAFATVWSAGLIAVALIVPRFDSYRPLAELAIRANAVANGRTVVVTELPESQVLYYLDGPAVRCDTPDRFRSMIQPGADVLVVGPQSAEAWLKEAGVVSRLDQCATVHKKRTEAERVTVFAFTAKPVEGIEPTKLSARPDASPDKTPR